MRSLALAALVLAACSSPDDAAPPARAGSADPPAERPPEGLLAPAAIAAALPDALGDHLAERDAERGTDRRGALVTTWASREYRRGESVAVLRVLDATRAPDLIVGFAAAQHIELPAGDDGFELLPTGIGERPALASWDPSTGTSEAQVLVRSRLIVAVAVHRAGAPERAVEALEAAPLDALEALLR